MQGSSGHSVCHCSCCIGGVDDGGGVVYSLLWSDFNAQCGDGHQSDGWGEEHEHMWSGSSDFCCRCRCPCTTIGVRLQCHELLGITLHMLHVPWKVPRRHRWHAGTYGDFRRSPYTTPNTLPLSPRQPLSPSPFCIIACLCSPRIYALVPLRDVIPPPTG